MAIYKTETGVDLDQLLAGPGTTFRTANVTLKSGQDIKRGQLLKSDGDKYEKVTAAADEAVVVAMADVNATEDTVITVFTAGAFHREHLVVEESDKVEAHEAQLRGVGIIVTSVK